MNPSHRQTSPHLLICLHQSNETPPLTLLTERSITDQSQVTDYWKRSDTHRVGGTNWDTPFFFGFTWIFSLSWSFCRWRMHSAPQLSLIHKSQSIDINWIYYVSNDRIWLNLARDNFNSDKFTVEPNVLHLMPASALYATFLMSLSSHRPGAHHLPLPSSSLHPSNPPSTARWRVGTRPLTLPLRNETRQKTRGKEIQVTTWWRWMKFKGKGFFKWEIWRQMMELALYFKQQW